MFIINIDFYIFVTIYPSICIFELAYDTKKKNNNFNYKLS